MSYIEYLYLGLLLFAMGIAFIWICTRVAALTWFREKRRFINELKGKADGEEEI